MRASTAGEAGQGRAASISSSRGIHGRRERAGDEAQRARLADQIQVRAYQVVPYINGGQWKQFTAVRTNVSGLGETTVTVFWEVAKEGVIRRQDAGEEQVRSDDLLQHKPEHSTVSRKRPVGSGSDKA
jgi:hypothetical protein